jgi:hypothetical protein
MAGQRRQGPRRRGRSSSVALVPVGGAASAAASGSPTEATSPGSTNGHPTPPATRATYRSLLLKGLAPDEAANLTAFLCGIHVGAQPWKLLEVNRLLFLRELQLSGRFGIDDGA